MTLDTLRCVTIGLVASDAPDLSARQMAVLLQVGLIDGPHTVRGLAATLNVSKPAITRALDRLGDDPAAGFGLNCHGLVRRRPDPSDRRSVLVTLTDAGRAYLRDLDARIAEAERPKQRQAAA